MPKPLPPDLAKRLRETLLRCGPFDSDSNLRSVFVDSRIAAWHDACPDNTASRAQRVAAFIESLFDQSDNAGNSALALALQVLADCTPIDNACHHDLAELARALQNPSAADTSSSPQSPPQVDKYNIHIHGGQVGVIGDNAKIEGGIHFEDNDTCP